MAKKQTKKNDNDTTRKTKKSLVPLLKFLGKFLLVIILYYSFILIVNDSIFDFYLHITASVASVILNIFGQVTQVSGNMIGSSDTIVMLSFGCEGTEPIIVFLAGIISIPLKFKQKWLPAIVGIITLYSLNFIRIVGLFFIQKYHTGLFDSFHNVIFPLIFILFALLCLALCIKWASKR